MTSATIKRPCAKCDKGAGTAMCYGCEQSFCTKHFNEHRQELSQQIDNISQEHDILQQDLTQQQDNHPLLARINQWEQESIAKIQTAAESARTDLQQLLNRTKNNLKTSVSKMTEELQSSRESDDYAELDITKWTDQLKEFRKMLDSPTSININYENDTRSAVYLIKVTDQQSSDSFHSPSQLHKLNTGISHNLNIVPIERFAEMCGKIELSENGLLATCLGQYLDKSSVSGIGQYSSGIHYIRFRIEQLNRDDYTFFGIVQSSEKLTTDIWTSKSLHGWWDLDDEVVAGVEKNPDSPGTYEPGDELTLMLDCDNRQIQIEHHRTHTTVCMPIDLQLCTFPWKMTAFLFGKGHCVRILQ